MIARRDRDRIIEVSARIKALRRELEDAEDELDTLLNDEEPVAEETDPGSVTKSIIALLDSNAHRIVTAEWVADNLPGSVNIRTVRATLARLFLQKKISRVSRGAYTSMQELTEADLEDDDLENIE